MDTPKAPAYDISQSCRLQRVNDKLIADNQSLEISVRYYRAHCERILRRAVGFCKERDTAEARIKRLLRINWWWLLFAFLAGFYIGWLRFALDKVVSG